MIITKATLVEILEGSGSTYEVGDKVKVLVEYDSGKTEYRYGYILFYPKDNASRYRVSIEGVGDTYASKEE